MEMVNKIKVLIRVKPTFNESTKINKKYWKITGNKISTINVNCLQRRSTEFEFDRIYVENSKTSTIFNENIEPIIASGLEGISSTIVTYGHTNSGKSYTMMGRNKNLGILPLACHSLFNHVNNSQNYTFLIKVSCVQVYNEIIYDLLDNMNVVDILEKKKVNNINCAELTVTSAINLIQIIDTANKKRKTSRTNMNICSSQSHVIFRIIIESCQHSVNDDDEIHISHLNFVDLAGSEKLKDTKATGTLQKEGSKINLSLTHLSTVIRSLNCKAYVNFRDSKLTRILKESLSGEGITMFICTITLESLEETYTTLEFGSNARTIENKLPIIKKVLSSKGQLKTKLEAINNLEKEVKILKQKSEVEKAPHNKTIINLKQLNLQQLRSEIIYSPNIRKNFSKTNLQINKEVSKTSLPHASKCSLRFSEANVATVKLNIRQSKDFNIGEENQRRKSIADSTQNDANELNTYNGIIEKLEIQIKQLNKELLEKDKTCGSGAWKTLQHFIRGEA
ncbi:uncharacterized protein [Prorops nasuta]|uniref:uncharacterized protein isoform X1 n=1 Tax=Prorops nasuta TaxID=863751 RepID=UPI0034CE8547